MRSGWADWLFYVGGLWTGYLFVILLPYNPHKVIFFLGILTVVTFTHLVIGDKRK